MKADKVISKIKISQDKYGIDPRSLMILGYVMDEWKAGEVTIMNLLENFWRSSRATTHTHVKKLFAKKILCVKQSKDDGRKKLIEKGTKFDEFIAFLEE